MKTENRSQAEEKGRTGSIKQRKTDLACVETARSQHACAGERDKEGEACFFLGQSETRLPVGCRAVKELATRIIVSPHRLHGASHLGNSTTNVLNRESATRASHLARREHHLALFAFQLGLSSIGRGPVLSGYGIAINERN